MYHFSVGCIFPDGLTLSKKRILLMVIVPSAKLATTGKCIFSDGYKSTGKIMNRHGKNYFFDGYMPTG